MCLCAATGWGQTWHITSTMTATLDKGVLTISTTADSEAMPMPQNAGSKWPWDYPWIALHAVIFENKITSIGNYLFDYIEGYVTSVVISNSVTVIGAGAFGACNRLTSITIPNSVTTIGRDAFSYCPLTSITIPSSVTTIGTMAFATYALKNVTVEWTVPLSVPENPFFEFLENNVSRATLHVPVGTKALYEADPIWGKFGTIKEMTVISEETRSVYENGQGNISLSMVAPRDATLTGSFEIQFPDGMTLNEELTSLADGLSAGFSLSFTSKEHNTWLIEIQPKALRSASTTEYSKFIDIAYKVDGDIPSGAYQAIITNLDFEMNDETSIQEDFLAVYVYVDADNPTSVEFIPNTPFSAYFVGNVLRIESPQPETVTVYSVTGAQLYSTVKDAGMTDIPLPSQNGTVYIIKGSVSGMVKVIK